MSVDLEATLREPVTLAALIERAYAVLSDLLGIITVPNLAVFVDRRYQKGIRVVPGRCLGAAELAATVIGGPIAQDVTGLSGSIHFEIDVRATGDGVRLMVLDYHDEHFGEFRGYRHAVFSPCRTCVGVTVATGLALAAAQLACGEYLDEEIRMLRPEARVPGQVIDRTRLPEGSGDFAAQCEKYLRQFPDLNGWPRDRSTG